MIGSKSLQILMRIILIYLILNSLFFVSEQVLYKIVNARPLPRPCVTGAHTHAIARTHGSFCADFRSLHRRCVSVEVAPVSDT